MGQPVILYGASGYARDWHYALVRQAEPADVVAFIDDFRGDRGESLDGIPVLSLEEARRLYPSVPFAITVADPSARRHLASKVNRGGGRFRSFYEVGDWISPSVTVGQGTLIAQSPTYIGSGTKIGHHSMIMVFCTIGHDCVIGDYVTVCPSVNISGYVVVEDDVFIGVSATIVNGAADEPLRIGRGAVIFAGAVVMKPVPAGAKVAGNPASDLRSVLAESRRDAHGRLCERQSE